MSGPLDPTQFTRESAERIANVVRAAELSAPVARPLTFERVDFVRNQKSFRIATFTGSWPTGTDKTVTFKYGATATAVATNLFFPITRTAAAGDCGIAKDGTAWYLIDVPFETATAVFVGATSSTSVMTDVTLSASLNTSACTISIGKTLVTSAVTIVTSTFTASFVRFKV